MAPLLTKEIEECVAHAAHCAQRANLAASPGIRDDFLRLEQNWLQLARSYEIAQEIAPPRKNGEAQSPAGG